MQSVHVIQQMVFRQTHLTTCAFVRHENFIDVANAPLPPNNRQWIQHNSVCSFSETCMFNQCDVCKDGTLLKDALQNTDEVDLYQ